MNAITPTHFSAPGPRVKLIPGNGKRRFDAASEADLNLHLVAQIRRKLAQKRAREEARRILQQPAHTTSPTTAAKEKA